MKNALVVVVIVVIVAVFIGIGLVKKGSGPASGAKRIAVIPKGTSSVYWESVHTGALQAGAELGYEISWNGPELETDRERQIQIVNDFIAQKVAGVVLAPNDAQALVPVVEEMHDKNIPCVIIDSGIDTDKYVSFAATDNYQGGAIAAKRLAEILGGEGKVIVVKFIPNSASTDARVAGFMETISKDFPEIEIIDDQYGMGTVETALAVTEDMLTKNSKLDGLFACNASTSTAAAQALKSQKRAGKVKMVGFDAEPTLIDNLRDGTIDALVVQDPVKMGYIGVKTIVAKLNGEEVSKQIDTGVWLVKKDDLENEEVKVLLSLQ